jgi:methyltransferase-like protein/SAM-dependent methyltransferase
MSEEFSYNVVPYPGAPFPQTHPDTLAAAGTIFGMDAPPVEDCRVLELGCGDGINLLSMAATLPRSKFVGMDLSELGIRSAKQFTQELSFPNVEFFKEDVMDFTRDRYGEFDFIVAHGLYSWVPDFVRERVLEIYAECLKPNGIGFISYNVLPGYRIWQIARDIMRFYGRDIIDPMERVRGAATSVGAVAAASKAAGRHYQIALETVFANLNSRSPENVFHDELADNNEPFCFYHFDEALSRVGLQYLCEIDPLAAANRMPESLPTHIIETIGDDLVKKEQYIDFVSGRTFRCSLICRGDVKVDRAPGSQILDRFFLSSPLQQQVSVNANGGQTFLHPEGGKLEIEAPLTSLALTYIASQWPRSVSFHDLIGEMDRAVADSKSPATESDVQHTVDQLLEFHKLGLLNLRRFQPLLTNVISDRPQAFPFARWQVTKSSKYLATAAASCTIVDDELQRLMLFLLDGTLDREALADAIKKRVQVSEERAAGFETDLPAIIGENLGILAAAGLLVE